MDELPQLASFAVISATRHVDHSDALRVPHAVLLSAGLDCLDITVWRHPCAVIAVVVPGRAQWMVVDVDFFHFADVDFELEHDLVALVGSERVALGLLDVAADVHAFAQQSACGWLEAVFDDIFGVAQMCAMIHGVNPARLRLLILGKSLAVFNSAPAGKTHNASHELMRE